jgi:hypothetical protein
MNPPPIVIHIFGSIMMPTYKVLQVWLKRPETDNYGKNQIVMIKPSMPRQGLQVMLFLVILDGFSCLFPREDKRVSHHGLAIYIQKYLKAKQDLWKLKNFTMQNIIYKNSSTRNQNAFKYYNSVTNLKFQHKPKYHLSNHIKIGLLLPRGQNTLSYYTL